MLYINDLYRELDNLFKSKERTKQNCRDCINMFKDTNDIFWYNISCSWLRCAVRDELIIKKILEIRINEL